jgi:hypothetical protein
MTMIESTLPPPGSNNFDGYREELEPVAEHLVQCLVDARIGVKEGEVMTPGPPPYRRLDCDARALCYIRVRPKKRAVRVDLSGLWRFGGECRFRVPGSTGMASFMIGDVAHAEELARYLIDIIYFTRRQYAAERARKKRA